MYVLLLCQKLNEQNALTKHHFVDYNKATPAKSHLQ